MAKKVKSEKEYIKELQAASEAYYNGEDTVMSDEEFDNLRDEFLTLYPNSEFRAKVGAKVQSTFKVVKHRIPMGSLLKVNTKEETLFFYEKYANSEEIVWSEKLDGLSISLYYEKGNFTQAVTRGDGIEGEDVTENVRKMNFKKKLTSPYTGDIRAEIVLSKANYKKYFSDKANPRNAASGAVRRLDGERCEHLDVYAYYLEEGHFETEIERFKKLKELGLATPKHGVCKKFDDIQAVWERYENGDRDAAPYEIDGICLFVNSIEIQNDLGIVDGRPRYARAYKFSPQSAVTEIEEVVWQVGRTGRITPVAKIKPVNVAGATISNVSLHNLAEIKRKNLQLNQVVHVERKGDVIPQITKSVGEGTPIEILKKCPSCGSNLVKEDIFLLCTNSAACPEQQVQNLIFWMTVLDIKGFGDKMVQKLFEKGLVNDPSDFYKLKEDDIANVERSGEKIAKKLIAELHSKKEVEPELFIKALGMEDVGEGVSKLILEKYAFNDIFKLTEDQLLDIHGIGEETAKKVVSGFKTNKSKITNLLKIIVLKEKKQGKFTGVSFCFTGFRDKNLEEKIKDNGGTISDSVNKALNYLVVKSIASGSSKIEKAKKNGVQILEISDLEKLLS